MKTWSKTERAVEQRPGVLRVPALFALLASTMWAPTSAGATEHDRVILFVVDGVRRLEVLGLAKDDFGRVVSSRSLLPNFSALIRPRGVLYKNFEISNKVGLSLPAYSEIFTGHRQPGVKTNTPLTKQWSSVPSLLEIIRNQGKLDRKNVVVLASWGPLCSALTSGRADHSSFAPTARCGPQAGDLRRSPFSRSRSDQDTLLDALATLKNSRPRFLAIVLGEADEEGHLQHRANKQRGQNYGIYHYHEAVRRSDYAMRRIWNYIRKDPFYRNKTTLLFTTDHGRDSDLDRMQWATHGWCVQHRQASSLCDGCRRIFLHVTHPPRETGLRLVPRYQRSTHLNIAPTVLLLMGLDPPDWMEPGMVRRKRRRNPWRDWNKRKGRKWRTDR